MRENNWVSRVSFENTNTINFFLTGFECEEKAVSMVLAARTEDLRRYL